MYLLLTRLSGCQHHCVNRWFTFRTPTHNEKIVWRTMFFSVLLWHHPQTSFHALRSDASFSAIPISIHIRASHTLFSLTFCRYALYLWSHSNLVLLIWGRTDSKVPWQILGRSFYHQQESLSQNFTVEKLHY